MRFCSVMSLLMPRSHSWESSTILVTSRNSQILIISGPGEDPQLEAGQCLALHRLLMKT